LKVLGIDIGGFSIKAVLLESTFRSLQVVRFAESPLPIQADPHPPEVIVSHLKTALSQLKGESDRVASSLPGDVVSHKMIELPFKDKRKIDQTLEFELEDLTPFPLEDTAFDYFIASTEGNVSSILTTQVYKENLREFIETLELANIDADLITTIPHALFTLTLVNLEIPVRTAAILDIGHRRTSLCLIHDGKLEIARTIQCAGLDVTKEISDVYRVSLEEAEEVKIDRGFVLDSAATGVTDEQIQFSDVISNALSPIVREVNQTLLAYRAKTKHPIDIIYLSGGTALLRNIAAYLHDEWHIKVQPLKLFQHYHPGPSVQPNTEVETKMATAVGNTIATLAQIRPYKINLRKGEFSSTMVGVSVFSKYRQIFIIGGIMAALFFTDIGAKYYFLSKDQSKLDALIAAEIKKTFPKVPKHVLASNTKLQALIDEQLSEQDVAIRELSETAAPPLKAIEVLSQISHDFPGTTIKIEELNITSKRVQLIGLAESIDQIEKLSQNLNKVESFENVSKGEIVTAADGVNKKFTITLDITE